jgi:hypothetical protein
LDSRAEPGGEVKPTVFSGVRKLGATHAPARNDYNNNVWSKARMATGYARQKTPSISAREELKDVAAKCCAFEFVC